MVASTERSVRGCRESPHTSRRANDQCKNTATANSGDDRTRGLVCRDIDLCGLLQGYAIPVDFVESI